MYSDLRTRLSVVSGEENVAHDVSSHGRQAAQAASLQQQQQQDDSNEASRQSYLSSGKLT